MSWGNKLVVVFILFALLMGTLVYKAVNTKFELVSKDYYKDELRYQEKLDGAANAANAGNIIISQDAEAIYLKLPETIQGNARADAWFYCKTNAAHDQRFRVNIEKGNYIFDRSKFAKDDYELKLQFTVEGKQYYYSIPVSIQ